MQNKDLEIRGCLKLFDGCLKLSAKERVKSKLRILILKHTEKNRRQITKFRPRQIFPDFRMKKMRVADIPSNHPSYSSYRKISYLFLQRWLPQRLVCKRISAYFSKPVILLAHTRRNTCFEKFSYEPIQSAKHSSLYLKRT